MANRRISHEYVEVLQKNGITDVEKAYLYITEESVLFNSKKETTGHEEKYRPDRPSATYTLSPKRDIVATLIGLFDEIDN